MEDTNPYVNKIMKEVHLYPYYILSKESLKFISIMLEGVLRKILKSYQTNQDLYDIIRKLLVGKLSSFGLSTADKAINKFTLSLKETSEIEINETYYLHKQKYELKTRSYYAGLTFLTLTIENYLKKLGYSKYSDYFIIFLTAIIEYITAEITQLSGDIARNKMRNLVLPEDIIEAINNDKELLKLSNKIFGSKSSNWEMYFNNYSSFTKKNISIKKEGLLKFTENKIINETGKTKIVYEKIPIDNEFTYDNSKMIENELIKLEEDKIEFELEYSKELEEIKNRELEDNKEEIFIFTKSELEEYNKKIIGEYINSLNNQQPPKKKIGKIYKNI